MQGFSIRASGAPGSVQDEAVRLPRTAHDLWVCDWEALLPLLDESRSTTLAHTLPAQAQRARESQGIEHIGLSGASS